MIKKHFISMILCPLLLGLILSIICSITLHKYIPKDLNTTKWSEFSHSIEKNLQIENKLYASGILMTIHSLQILCCIPLLHITKIFYGYWLGIIQGFSLCVSCEFLLYFLCLKCEKKTCLRDFQKYVSEKRSSGLLIFSISFICLSNLPLQTKLLVFKFSDISMNEFLIGSMIPTSVMTMKNVVVGSVLAQSPSHSSIAIMTIIISFSLVLPTLSTVYFSSNMILLMNSLGNEIVEEVDDLVQLPLINSEEICVNVEKNPDNVDTDNIEVIQEDFESESSSQEEKCALIHSTASLSG